MSGFEKRPQAGLNEGQKLQIESELADLRDYGETVKNQAIEKLAARFRQIMAEAEEELEIAISANRTYINNVDKGAEEGKAKEGDFPYVERILRGSIQEIKDKIKTRLLDDI